MILVVGNAGRGGVDTHLEAIYPHIKKCPIMFFLPDRRGLESIKGVRLPYIKLKSLENLSLGLSSLLYLILNPGTLKKIEKIHAHNPFTLLPLLPLKIMGRDMILSMHMWANLKSFQRSLKSPIAVIPAFFGTILFSIVMKSVDVLIVLSEESGEFYRKRTGAKIIVIPNGIDVSLFKELTKKREELRKKYGVGDACEVMCFVGRLDTEKGPLKALEIFGGMKTKNTHLWMIGDGSLKDELLNRISEEGLNRVKLLGWLEKNQVYERLTASDIYIQPSEYEVMSMSLLEAVAAGNICISSFIPGELMDLEGVYRVESRIDAFREIISEEMNQGGREGMLEDRWRKLNEFDLGSCALRLQKIYGIKGS